MNTGFLVADDFWEDIHGPAQVGECLSIEDTLLSKDVPIVISYELADLDKTSYHFKQEFTLQDTQKYFEAMKRISCRSINELIAESDHNLHFYRTKVNKKVENLLKRLDPTCSPSAAPGTDTSMRPR